MGVSEVALVLVPDQAHGRYSAHVTRVLGRCMLFRSRSGATPQLAVTLRLSACVVVAEASAWTAMVSTPTELGAPHPGAQPGPVSLRPNRGRHGGSA